MAAHPIPTDLSTGDRMARGEIVRILPGNQSRSYRLTPREWSVYEQAKRDGYLIGPRADASYKRLANVWEEWCEPRQHPVCIVAPRTTFAAVEMDLIVLPPEMRLSPEAVELIRALLFEHATGHLIAWGDTFLWANRMPMAVAAHIAARMVAIATADLGVRRG